MRTKRGMEFLQIPIMGRRSVSVSLLCDWAGINPTWVTKAAAVSDTFNTDTAHVYFPSWALTVGMNNAVLI